jgi:phage-related protein (TIGR01555 family)
MTENGVDASQEKPSIWGAVLGSLRLDSFQNILTNIGMADVDPTVMATVAPVHALDEYQASELYRGNLYAQKSVDELVEAVLSDGWTVTHESHADLNDNRKALEKRVKFAQKLDMAIKLARPEGNAWLWIVTDDTHADDVDLSDPLDLDGEFNILQVQVLERAELIPDTWQGNPEVDDFGEPLTYSQTVQVNGSVVAGHSIHRSRLIELYGKKLSRVKRIENMGYDDSTFQAGYDQLRNGTVIEQVMARLVNEAKISIVKLNHSAAQKGVEGFFSFITSKIGIINRHKSAHNLVVLDKDEDFEQSQIQWTGLDKIKEKANEGLSAFASIPLVQLFGMAPAGMSTDDKASARNWNGRCDRLFTSDVTDWLERWYTVCTAAKNGPTNGQMLEDVVVKSGNFDKPLAVEQAEFQTMIAELDQLLIAAGVPKDVLLKHRYGGGEYNPQMPTLTEEQLNRAIELLGTTANEGATDGDH